MRARPAQPCGRLTQILERRPHGRQVVFPLAGQFHRTNAAQEQLHPKLILQLADLVADRGLRHMQFIGSPGKAEMPRRGFKRPKPVQSGERKGHIFQYG